VRTLKGVFPIAMTVGLILAVTAILWRINSTAAGSYHLVYIYLFPVALIAAVYNGRLALLGTAIALICADYFLQKPLYILGNDNPLEYGDLFVFGLLAVTTIKFVRVLARSSVSSLAAKTLQPTQKPSLVSSLAADRRPGSSFKADGTVAEYRQTERGK
jgi:K+-sensing histidine kinase KdpD